MNSEFSSSHKSGRVFKSTERTLALILREVGNRGEVLSRGEMRPDFALLELPWPVDASLPEVVQAESK